MLLDITRGQIFLAHVVSGFVHRPTVKFPAENVGRRLDIVVVQVVGGGRVDNVIAILLLLYLYLVFRRHGLYHRITRFSRFCHKILYKFYQIWSRKSIPQIRRQIGNILRFGLQI